KDRWLLPTTEMVYGVETAAKGSRQIFWELAAKYDRLPKPGDPRHAAYIQRIEYELSVLVDNPKRDLMPYFFVLEDVCDYFRKRGELWNTRGSAGGSLVVYALGISLIDPMRYDLPFERLINLGRIMSLMMPDVDT